MIGPVCKIQETTHWKIQKTDHVSQAVVNDSVNCY